MQPLQSAVYQETTIKNKRFNLIKALNLELFTDHTYLIIVIGLGITYVSELNIVLMISFILAELANFSRTPVATANSILSVVDMVGRLVVPIIAHKCKWSPKVMYACALVTSSIGRTGLVDILFIQLEYRYFDL